MKEKYIKQLTAFFKELHVNLQEKDKQLAELFDKIIVWIVGLSTGSVVLIISSADKLKIIDKQVIGKILLLLIICIITGIVGRILSSIAIYISYSQAVEFDYQLQVLQMPSDKKLHGTETAEEVYQCFIEDFDADFPSTLSGKKETPKENWPQMDSLARKFYEDYTNSNKAARAEAMKEIGAITISAYGLRPNAFEKKIHKFNRLKGIVNRNFNAVSYFLYIVSAISFCIAISYLAYTYMQNFNR